MKFTFCLLTFFLSFFSLKAQSDHVGISVSNNVTSFPVTGYPKVFYSKLHPGLDLYYHKKWNSSSKHQVWYNGNIGVFYHRFFQTAVKLNGGLNYQFHFNGRWNLETGLNGGYLHSFCEYQIFERNENGDYVKVSGIKGRPQFNFGINAGAGYGVLKEDPNKLRLNIQFKAFFQGLFAGSFVPIVPYNNFSIGLTYRYDRKK